MTGRNGQKLKPKPVTNARDDKLSTAFGGPALKAAASSQSRPGPNRKVKRGR
jgi:hypothetical protein